MDNPDGFSLATMRAVLDRLIPPDEDPGATDLGVDAYVMRQLAGDARAVAPAIAEGLAAVEAASPGGFASLDPDRQDALLRDVEASPWFKSLIELAAEGFYADPGNGGNRDARSWTMIGYEHRLPDGPSGPAGHEPIHAGRPSLGPMPADAGGGRAVPAPPSALP